MQIFPRIQEIIDAQPEEAQLDTMSGGKSRQVGRRIVRQEGREK